MPKPRKGPRLGSGPDHQKLMLANLCRSLILDDARRAGGMPGRVKTTAAKAKAVKPLVERLITKAKHGTLHDRRQVMAVLRDKDLTYWLFTNVAARYEDRDGGYSRITKLPPRKGDGAEMAYIELV
ncbi:MAG: 50S ribosomal protein L17 [Acidimicrobiia bacterium]